LFRNAPFCTIFPDTGHHRQCKSGNTRRMNFSCRWAASLGATAWAFFGVAVQQPTHLLAFPSYMFVLEIEISAPWYTVPMDPAICGIRTSGLLNEESLCCDARNHKSFPLVS